ncbi:hypothetical protein BGZ68_000639 [Mortierella alpina]|nr:hypothetical protein BGZ68_000639 [Mortierella alpina]
MSNNNNNHSYNSSSDSDEDLVSFSDFQIGDYVKSQPQASFFKPDKRLLKLCPNLDGRDFYAPPSDSDSYDPDDEQDAFETALTDCPKNKHRKYTAPPITDLPWPEKHKLRQQFDHDLQGIQSNLATLTRPVDKMVLDILDDARLSADQMEEFLATAGGIMRHIKRISHQIYDLCVQNLDKAHDLGVLTKKNNRPALVDSSKLLERKKLVLSVRKTLYSRGDGRGNNKGSYSNGRSNYPSQSQSSSSYHQQQHQDTIAQGYKIPFETPPPLASTSTHTKSQKLSTKETGIIEKEILSLLSKKAIESASSTTGFTSRLFLVPRKQETYVQFSI